MTIDERLDRLVERHEALTQTVEHLACKVKSKLSFCGYRASTSLVRASTSTELSRYLKRMANTFDL